MPGRNQTQNTPVPFQYPNPLDLLFFGFDRAMQRLSLPGAFIHIQVGFHGQIDINGLRRAVACIHRLHPVTQSRLEWSPVLGHPRWRLDVDPPKLDRVVGLHLLKPATEEEFNRRIQLMMGVGPNLTSEPPLKLDVLRGLHRGDVLVIRWPHALMDGRGGLLLLEEIQRLYHEHTDPLVLYSRGDEKRDDFARLISKDSRRTMQDDFPSSAHESQPRTRESIQLPPLRDLRDLGPLRHETRRLNSKDCERAREVCERLCPSVRFGAFLRACALRALHRIIPANARRGHWYSIPYILEGREPPYRKPVCRNLFSLDRRYVRSHMATDRGAVATHLHEETADLLARGPMTRYLKTARRASRLPTAILATLTRQCAMSEPRSWQRGDLGDPPSLPMGFMRAFTQDISEFCGAELDSIYTFRPPLPRAGIGIQVNADRGQLFMTGLSYEKRFADMRRFLDHFVAGLIDEN